MESLIVWMMWLLFTPLGLVVFFVSMLALAIVCLTIFGGE